MKSYSFNTYGVFQMPFFAFLMEKLIQFFMAYKTLILFGSSAYCNRSALFPATKKRVNNFQ
jgi:hypothetical protein